MPGEPLQLPRSICPFPDCVGGISPFGEGTVINTNPARLAENRILLQFFRPQGYKATMLLYITYNRFKCHTNAKGTWQCISELETG